MADAEASPLKTTPLDGLHRALGAKMAGFAGYDMPIHYPLGVLQEHLHTRAAAGLFDVSHMGQAFLEGKDAAARLETLVPGDIAGLGEGRTRYTQLLDENGGILDDLMVTRLSGAAGGDEKLFLVVNAGTKDADFAHIAAGLPDLRLTRLDDRALVALQGPKAAAIVEGMFPGAGAMPFMSLRMFERAGGAAFVSRSGYTGEDGYEISVPAAVAQAFAKTLLAHPDVKPVGLGARDSLRLEAGLCLYGHDIDETTTPVEATLLWSIGKRRREGGGFPGAARLQDEIANGPPRRRVGLKPEGRAPAREGAEIATPEGRVIGKVTSGGFGPTVNGPVAMGYVEAGARTGDAVNLVVRGRPLPARIVDLPFVPARFYRAAR